MRGRSSTPRVGQSWSLDGNSTVSSGSCCIMSKRTSSSALKAATLFSAINNSFLAVGVSLKGNPLECISSWTNCKAKGSKLTSEALVGVKASPLPFNSTPKSSSIGSPKTSANLSRYFLRGLRSPVSQRATAKRETPKRLARVSCVQPLSKRNCLIRSPMLAINVSLTLTLYPILTPYKFRFIFGYRDG